MESAGATYPRFLARAKLTKKKTEKIIEKGKIYITATFNNTVITVTDEKGNPMLVASCGMYGFTGTRKPTPYAATITTSATLKKAIIDHGLRFVDIFVNGI